MGTGKIKTKEMQRLITGQSSTTERKVERIIRTEEKGVTTSWGSDRNSTLNLGYKCSF